MKYFLTYDVGTTSVKTCIFNEQLKMQGYSNEEYELITKAGGIVEAIPARYWEAVQSGTLRACQNAGVAPAQISAISITTQGETLIPVDQEGEALYNAIVWLDERAGKEAEELSRRFDATQFYAKTGITELNGYVPVAKLVWIQKHLPEVYAQTYKFLLLEDYLIMRLTGAFVSEKALLSTSGWFDIADDCIWQEMLDAAGLDAQKLPDAKECGWIVDMPVRPEVRAALGLSENIVVVTSAMDQTTAALGAGNIIPGIVTETTGTGMCIGATVTKPDFYDASRVNLYRHIEAGKYLIIPVCMTAGMVLKWFKDEFCKWEQEEAKTRGCSAYDIISEQVAQIPPLANGLMLIPYLTGTLQPDNNPDARGIFYGVGLDTKRAHFQRAIFEAIAYMLRENVELIERVEHIHATEIRALGGGAKSKVWRQIKADVNATRIVSMCEEECSSLGAAMLAAVALGVYPNAETAASAGNRVAEGLEPNASLANAYDAAFEKYKKLYQVTKGL